jgi:hypothetical protein
LFKAKTSSAAQPRNHHIHHEQIRHQPAGSLPGRSPLSITPSFDARRYTAATLRFRAITTWPDGALWFTETDAQKIGRITTTGLITEFATSSGGGPGGITTWPDGALSFTDFFDNKIGRITTTGLITEFPLARSFSDFPNFRKVNFAKFSKSKTQKVLGDKDHAN